MSVGAVGSSGANSALWAKLQDSMQSKNTGGAEKPKAPTAAMSGASQNRMSGASQGSKGSMINIMA
jgi:hypothetical protein